MWWELRAVMYFFYLFFVSLLKESYIYLTEDKNAFVDFQLGHQTQFEFEQHPTLHLATVEVAVVCSKHFAENFNQDREKISDYLTAYFWDIQNARFRTLEESQISFSVTSLTIIKSKEEQPFIENSKRHPKDGHPSLDQILPLFQKWIFANASELKLTSFNVPSFDVAMLFLEPRRRSPQIDDDALAEFRGSCRLDGDRLKSAIVVRAGAMTEAMLELAKLLGAARQKTQCPHSTSFYSRQVRVMKKDLNDFFSVCADVQLANSLKSPSCLQTMQGVPIIDPDFDSALPPSILVQCRLLSGSRNATTVTTEAGNECALTKCQSSSGASVLITPLANSRCGGGGGGGRCFQGRCLHSGSLLTNVATGMCLLRDYGHLKYSIDQLIGLHRCPRSAAPFETFQVVEVNGTTEKMLRVPCQALSMFTEGTEMERLIVTKHKSKCFDMCLTPNYRLMLKECDVANPEHRWEFRDVNRNGEFLLYNVGRKMCSYFVSNITDFGKCDKYNPAMFWKLFPVLPEKPCPDAGDNCFDKPQLHPQLFFQWNSTNLNLLNINVSLQNPDGGMAVAPGVIVAWNRKSNLTLMRMPENCVSFAPPPPPSNEDGDVINSLKCKVGRLMQKRNETTLVATLNFNATFNNLYGFFRDLPDIDFQEAMGFSVTPTMARLA